MFSLWNFCMTLVTVSLLVAGRSEFRLLQFCVLWNCLSASLCSLQHLLLLPLHLYASVITVSSLDCSSCNAFCSFTVKFEYLSRFDFSILLLTSLCVATINVSILWWFFVGTQFLFDGFLNLSPSIMRALFFVF